MKVPEVVLTIAGSDPCGGAGIQADIKTAVKLDTYPLSVITALTAQNSCKVDGVFDVDEDVLRRQLDCVLSDFSPQAVKIGLIASARTAKVVSEYLRELNGMPVILDPVLSPTLCGGEFNREIAEAIVSELMPLATLVTPNIPEREFLEEVAGKPLIELCEAVLVKGGHGEGGEAVDELYFHEIKHDYSGAPSTAFPTINFNHSSLFNHDDILPGDSGDDGYTVASKTFRHKKLETSNTHGTGCVLSTATACYMAKGYELERAVDNAIRFTYEAMRKSAKIKLSRGDYGACLI